MHIKWIIKEFDELTTMELYGLVRLRLDVFVTEQKITEPELDDQDLESYHAFGIDETGKVIAVARFFFENRQLFIGRVAVAQSHRHQGLGSKLLIQIEQYIRDEELSDSVFLHAQAYVQNFYEATGYEPIGDIFLEAGIEHILMKKNIQKN